MMMFRILCMNGYLNYIGTLCYNTVKYINCSDYGYLRLTKFTKKLYSVLNGSNIFKKKDKSANNVKNKLVKTSDNVKNKSANNKLKHSFKYNNNFPIKLRDCNFPKRKIIIKNKKNKYIRNISKPFIKSNNNITDNNNYDEEKHYMPLIDLDKSTRLLSVQDFDYPDVKLFNKVTAHKKRLNRIIERRNT